MYDFKKAKNLVHQYINRPSKHEYFDKELVTYSIIDEYTMIRPYGWIFCYQSDKYLEIKELQYVAVGNAPIVFEKETGKMIVTGISHNIDYYMDLYEKGQ